MTVQPETNPSGLQIFSRSTKYLSVHYHELLESYPKHYIVIYDGEVVGASPSRKDLFDDLGGKISHSGTPWSIIWRPKMSNGCSRRDTRILSVNPKRPAPIR